MTQGGAHDARAGGAVEGVAGSAAGGGRRRLLVAGVLLALVGAASQAVIAPPTSLLWLHPLAAAPFLLLATRASRGWGALLGWAWGATANAAIFAWLAPTIDRFTTLPRAGGVALLAVFALVFGFYGAAVGWGARAARARAGALWPVALAALFAGCELLNPQLFPYHQGSAWFQVPRIFLVAGLVGVPGVTFLVILASGLAAAAAEAALGLAPWAEARRTLARSGAVLSVLLAATLVHGGAREARLQRAMAEGPTLRVAMVQSGWSEEEARTRRRADPDAEVRDLLALSAAALADDPAIKAFVWPEGVLRVPPGHSRAAPLRAFVEGRGVSVWTGSFVREGPRGARVDRNQVVRLDPGGAAAAYDKAILVPFGEFVPLARLLPFATTLRAFPNVQPGEGAQALPGPLASIAPLVCYEAIQAGYVRAAARTGADLFVVSTFDGWFGDTAALDEHRMLAVSLAAATGVPMVRAATTGISTAVGADGVILGQLAREARGVLAVDVPLSKDPTLYTRVGDAFGWLCAMMGLLLGVPGKGEQRARRMVPLALVAASPLPSLIDPSAGWAEHAAVLACAACVLFGGRAWARLTPADVPRPPRRTSASTGP